MSGGCLIVISADLPDAVRQVLARARERQGDLSAARIGWVSPRDLTLTLRIARSPGRESADAIRLTLQRLAGAHSVLEVSVAGPRAVATPKGQLLVLPVVDSGPFLALSRALDAALDAYGFELDTTAPGIVLARTAAGPSVPEIPSLAALPIRGLRFTLFDPGAPSLTEVVALPSDAAGGPTEATERERVALDAELSSRLAQRPRPPAQRGRTLPARPPSRLRSAAAQAEPDDDADSASESDADNDSEADST